MRASSLPIAQHCSLAPTLESADSAAARHGRETHRLIHAALESRTLESDDEQAMSIVRGLLRWWQPPAGIVCEHAWEIDGITGHWDAAYVQMPTDITGKFDYDTSAGIAVVIDWKASEWNPHQDEPGKDLQTLAYCYAAAKFFGVDQAQAYICPLDPYKGAEDVEQDPDPWVVGPVLDRQALDVAWSSIRLIAAREPIATLGAHCWDCYARPNCPEYTSLAVRAPVELTRETALRGLMAVDAMRKLADAGEERVKAWILAHGGRMEADGRVYAQWPTKARKSYTVPEGKPGLKWGWRNG